VWPSQRREHTTASDQFLAYQSYLCRGARLAELSARGAAVLSAVFFEHPSEIKPIRPAARRSKVDGSGMGEAKNRGDGNLARKVVNASICVCAPAGLRVGLQSAEPTLSI